MSRKLVKKDSKFLARIVTEDPKPCAFCYRKVDDEVNYGKLYAIGDIQCHYFCVLLSCCLVQKGSDDTGLFGFQYKDILAELERCKKHKCSYCGQGGANLGCCVTSCRKQFHLPCGKEKNVISLFFGTFKSFCQIHAPKQKIPDGIMANAKLRKQGKKVLKNTSNNRNILYDTETETSDNMVCVICYEAVDGFPTLNTFWPPCCARDAWFHRNCLQRMALSAGMHYLKCPLCNDKEIFYESVIEQGYYVPDRDAAWELEQNAFSEIYERNIKCSAEECQCPLGRSHDADNGPWDIKLCLLCGSIGRHLQCIENISTSETYVCATCEPVAPTDLNTLAQTIEAVIQQEQAQAANANRHGPIMPSRMSLRRTKRRTGLTRPSSSRMDTSIVEKTELTNVTSSRMELNLKPPRRQSNSLGLSFSPSKDHRLIKDSCSPRNDQNSLTKDSFSPRNDQNTIKTSFTPSKDQNKLTKGIYSTKDRFSLTKDQLSPRNDQFSPIKDQNRLYNDHFSPSKIIENMKQNFLIDLNKEVVEKLRRKIMKPRPMCVKKKIVNDTLENILKNSKQKETVREWCSPKKHDTNETFEETANKENISKTPDKNPTEIGPANDDDSNSTFQLPSEFIADTQSDDSFNFDTPKRKTVEIKQDSSLEIFEIDQEHNIGIDVIHVEEKCQKSPRKPLKSPPKNKKIKSNKVLKFSPLGNDVDDVENFKKEYLNEVGRKLGENTKNPPKVSRIIDFDVDSLSKDTQIIFDESKNDIKKPAKRRLPLKDKNCAKKRKNSDSDLILQYNLKNKPKNKKLKKKNKKSLKNLSVTFDSESKNKNKLKTKLSINNKNIKLKIKWKKEQLHLKLESKSKIKKTKNSQKSPNLKQYLLQYPVEGKSNEILVKPEKDVISLKRKYIKQEKSPDKFKQTSIHNFFKVKSPNEK